MPRVARSIISRYGGMDGLPLMEAMLREVFPGRVAVLSAFGAESAVLLDLAARVDRGVRVVFLDTGKHFPQTLVYYRELVQRLGLTNVAEAVPDVGQVSRSDPDGTLHRADADACCAMRKVDPLDTALTGFSAWVTGRKRYQAGERSTLPTVEYLDGRIKVNPLARWSRDDVDAYFEARDLPRHPLAPMVPRKVSARARSRPRTLRPR